MIGVRNDVESEWGGASGRAFNGAMGKTSKGIDGVVDDMDGAKTAVSTYADDMSTVKSRMQQARDVATAGGLTVTDTQIEDPGESPPAPGPLPDDPTPDEKSAHTTAQSAVDEHAKKVEAYREATKIVNDARDKENAALRHLTKFGTGQLKAAPFTVASISSGLASEAIKRTSKFRTMAASYGRYADRALTQAMKHSAPSPAFTKAARLHAQFATKQSSLLDDAVKGPVSKIADKLPDRVKNGLVKNFGDFIPESAGSKLAKVGRATLGKVPVVGTGITALGVGYDISQGKDPTKAVVSGASSLAAGAAVGAMVGGPVGVVAGAAVGAGVGYVVDEWGDEIAGGAKAAGEAVTDGAKAVGGAVSDGVKSVGNAIGSIF